MSGIDPNTPSYDYTGQPVELPTGEIPSQDSQQTTESTIQSSETTQEGGPVQAPGNPSLQTPGLNHVTFSKVQDVFLKLLTGIKPSMFVPPLTQEELDGLILGYKNPKYLLDPELRARLEELEEKIDKAKSALWDLFPNAKDQYGNIIDNLDYQYLLLALSDPSSSVWTQSSFSECISFYSEQIDLYLDHLVNAIPAGDDQEIPLIEVLKTISEAIEKLEKIFREAEAEVSEEDLEQLHEMFESILEEIGSMTDTSSQAELSALQLTIVKFAEDLLMMVEAMDKFQKFQETLSLINSPEEFNESLNSLVDQLWEDFLQHETIDIFHILLFSEIVALVNQSEWSDQLISPTDLDSLMTDMEEDVSTLLEWDQGNLSLGGEEGDSAELQELLRNLKKLLSMMLILGLGNNIADITTLLRGIGGRFEDRNLIYHHPVIPG